MGGRVIKAKFSRAKFTTASRAVDDTLATSSRDS